MKNFDAFDAGQQVIVRPARYRTGHIFKRENGPLDRYWVKIGPDLLGPYGPGDLIHPDDPDRAGVAR